MSQETKATEAKVETIAAQPVAVVTTTPPTTEVDYAEELAKKDAEIVEIRTQKENYRKAYLKEAGALPGDNDTSLNGEDLDTKVKRLVQEQLLNTKESKAQAEKDALISQITKKNKELTLALQNRGQISTGSGQGSNQEKPEVKNDNSLSNDQIANLKARGWDDKKIEDFKKNLKKPV